MFCLSHRQTANCELSRESRLPSGARWLHWYTSHIINRKLRSGSYYDFANLSRIDLAKVRMDRNSGRRDNLRINAIEGIPRWRDQV